MTQICQDIISEKVNTSLKVVGEVMNVPMVAVRCIAKGAGLAVSDEQSVCIDENTLEVFADAYVRKLKAYFNSMTRGNRQVDIDECLLFENFCKEFKNEACKREKAKTWSDIDENALRNYFLGLIKEKTSQKCTTFLSFISAHLVQNLIGSIPENTIEGTLEKQEIRMRRHEILRKISERFKEIGLVRRTVVNNIRHDAMLHVVIQTGHYHIYSRSNKEEGEGYQLILLDKQSL